MKNLKIYSRYNPAPQVGLFCPEETMTQQQFLHDTDINNILAKFLRTGLMDNIGQGTYEDVSESADYRQSIHIIQEADAQFLTLPAKTRKEFDNDPAKFMDFIHTTQDQNRLVDLDLIPKPNPIQNPKIEPEVS